MKKIRFMVSLLCLLLVTALLPGAAFAAEEGTAVNASAPAEIQVYVSVSLQGQLAQTKDKAPAVLLPVTVSEGATVDTVLKALHKEYCPAGEEGYATADSQYGTSMTKLWGQSEGAGGYYVNGIMPWTVVDQTPVKDGDHVEVIIYRSDWSDSYAAFQTGSMTVGAGQQVELCLKKTVFDETGMSQLQPVVGAKLLLGDAKGVKETDYVTDENGKVTVSLTDLGDYIVSARTEKENLTAPVLSLKVRKYAVPDFADVQGHWAQQAIEYVLGQGYFRGSGESFQPKGTMTREMMVTVLWRLAGEPEAKELSSFNDVVAGSYYEKAIAWAAETDLVNGVGDGRFGVGKEVSREQLAAILYRYAQSQGLGFTGNWYFLLQFDDADQIGSWADEGMHWCVMKEILQGKGSKTLAPKASVTRAEAAVMLQRFDAVLAAKQQ